MVMYFRFSSQIKRSLRLLIILALSCWLAIAGGCNPTQLRTQAAGSQLVLVTNIGPRTFNYAVSRLPSAFFSLMYEGLIAQNQITAELEPALAESWTVSEDKRRITFTLRPGLKWSDGEPLDADDVVFTFNDVYLNPKIPTLYKDFLRIGSSRAFPSVRKLDRRRVEFTLPETFAPFLRYIPRLLILPAHALQESLLSTDANGQPLFLSTWGTDTEPQEIVGNGPYRLVGYAPSQRLLFERNPNYWRTDDGGNPQPYIDRIFWQIIPSTDKQLLRFRSGEVDSMRVRPEQFQLLKQGEKRGKYTVYNGGSAPGSTFVGFNLNRGRNAKGEPFVEPFKSRWFNNLAFRQAFAYAIDREQMNDNIYRGLGKLKHSVLGEQSPYYFSPEEGLKTYNYDPQKAKQILLEAGFKYNSQGELFDGDGNRVEFTLLVRSEGESGIDLAVRVREDLSKIGIKANLQILSLSTILQKLQGTRDWECYLGILGVGGSDFEPNLLSLFWSSSGSFHQFNLGPQPGKPTIEGWEVSDWEREIDRLLAAGAKELDENKRRQIYGKFQQVIAEQQPLFFLVNSLRLQAVRDRVKNVKFSAFGGDVWNVYELKIDDGE